MPETMTVAEALTELKRIAKLLPRRFNDIGQYCSKRKGAPDTIEHQADYVKEQRQSAEDLIERYAKIKNAIVASNLKTFIVWKNTTMSVYDAIIWKSNVRNRTGTSISDYLEALYASFHDNMGEHQIEQYMRYKSMGRLEEEEMEKLELVVERYYNPREIKDRQEELLELRARIDALIDASNHSTHIEI